MILKKFISERETRIPIEPANIEEASLLLYELGSRRSAIARYEELKALDTDVSHAAASIIKRKILRADEIHAWSNSVKRYYSENESENSEAVLSDIASNGDSGFHNGQSDMPSSMLPSLFLPYLSTIVEANIRLKDIDRQGGIVGVDCVSVKNYEEAAAALSEIDDEELNDIYLWDAIASEGLTGYMFFSTPNAKQVYESLNVSDGNKCVLYRADAENVVWEHGNMSASCSYAIYRLYLALLFNKTISGNCYYIADKEDTLGISVFSPNLKGYSSLLGTGHDSKMNVIQYQKGPIFNHSEKQQLGDFPGVHIGPARDTMGSSVAQLAGDVVGGTLIYKYGRPFLGKVISSAASSTTGANTAAVKAAIAANKASTGANIVGQGGIKTYIKGLGPITKQWFYHGSKKKLMLEAALKSGAEITTTSAKTAATTSTNAIVQKALANSSKGTFLSSKFGSKILGAGKFFASKHIIAGICWLIVGGLIAGFLSKKAYQMFDRVTFGGFGWADYFTRFEAVIAKSQGIIQPTSQEFQELIKQGLTDTSKLDQCIGIHQGYVQSDDRVPEIIEQINEGVVTVEDTIANGWLSSLNNCGYRL